MAFLSVETRFEIVRQFKMVGDIDAVAEVMNGKGISYAEVEEVISEHLAKERWFYAKSAILCLLVGIGIGCAVAVLTMASGRLPLKLTALSAFMVLVGIWCGYRTINPK